jgi:copper chaperone
MRPFACGPVCATLKQEQKFMNARENIAGTSSLETHDIGIEGMTCDNCVRTVEKALRGVQGVTKVHVNRGAALATVTFDATKTHMPDLHDALLKSGYRPSAQPAA